MRSAGLCLWLFLWNVHSLKRTNSTWEAQMLKIDRRFQKYFVIDRDSGCHYYVVVKTNSIKIQLWSMTPREEAKTDSSKMDFVRTQHESEFMSAFKTGKRRETKHRKIKEDSFKSIIAGIKKTNLEYNSWMAVVHTNDIKSVKFIHSFIWIRKKHDFLWGNESRSIIRRLSTECIFKKHRDLLQNKSLIFFNPSWSSIPLEKIRTLSKQRPIVDSRGSSWNYYDGQQGWCWRWRFHRKRRS